MSFRTGLLAAVQGIRKIPHALDLRQHTVTVRVRQWSGDAVGLLTPTNTDTVLTIGDGSTPPRVQKVSSRDVVASGGLLTNQDLKVGPVTPDFVGGGIASSVIDPALHARPQEVFFKITGPGFPAAGAWYSRIHDETLPNFSRWLYLRATAVTFT